MKSAWESIHNISWAVADLTWLGLSSPRAIKQIMPGLEEGRGMGRREADG